MREKCHARSGILAHREVNVFDTILAGPKILHGGGYAYNFHQGDAPTSCPDVTVTCAGGYWGPTNHIRLIIPPGINMTWDTTVTSVNVTGTAQSSGPVLSG